MSEIKSPEEYQAEISMLNHEIYELNILLDSKIAEQEQLQLLDKYNPFDNPTDYYGFGGDYSVILPQIAEPGCKIPLEPNKGERKCLRHFYSIGGTCILLNWGAAAVLFYALLNLVMLILKFSNPEAASDKLYDYICTTSIASSIIAITFLITNTVFSIVGFKWAKISPQTLIKTKGFSFAKAFQYCFSAVFIYYVAEASSTILTFLVGKYDFSADFAGVSSPAHKGIGFIVFIVYSCIVAPITEEIFFRGMLLKLFSKANQRFAIFAVSVFFGLSHGNLSHFLMCFLLGIFLAHIDLKHNSILPSIIVHIFIDTVSIALDYLHIGGMNTASAVLNAVYMLAVFLGGIMFVEFAMKNKLPSTTPQQSRRGFALAKSSVPLIFALGIQLAYIVVLALGTDLVYYCIM